MGQKETDQLNQILHGVALTRAMCTVADLGVADHIEAGKPRSAAYLAQATRTHERSLYRLLRFLASHGLFQETKSGEFDHTPLSSALRSGVEGSFRAAAQLFHHEFRAWANRGLMQYLGGLCSTISRRIRSLGRYSTPG